MRIIYVEIVLIYFLFEYYETTICLMILNINIIIILLKCISWKVFHEIHMMKGKRMNE